MFLQIVIVHHRMITEGVSSRYRAPTAGGNPYIADGEMALNTPHARFPETNNTLFQENLPNALLVGNFPHEEMFAVTIVTSTPTSPGSSFKLVGLISDYSDSVTIYLVGVIRRTSSHAGRDCCVVPQ